MNGILPVKAVTVSTVSIPVVVNHAPAALTADLRAFEPVVGSVDVSTISVPAYGHVASQVCSPVLPRMSAGLLTAKNKPTAVPPREIETCVDHEGYPLPCDRCAESKVA